MMADEPQDAVNLPPVFTSDWRRGHAEVADEMLTQAAKLLTEPLWSKLTGALTGQAAIDRVLVAGTLANLAAAHYAAANVRARPS